MRGLGSVETGQRLLEGVEMAHSVYRSDIDFGKDLAPCKSVYERTRQAVIVFERLAEGLRS